MFRHPPIRAPLGDVTTERLELRRFRETDLDELVDLFAQPEVWRFPYGRGFTRAETVDYLADQIAAWDASGFGCWLARERSSGGIAGYVGLSVPASLAAVLPAVEVGWRFDPRCWGRGLATEGARAALREGFETLGLETICSLPQVGNPASSRVCERLGMRLAREIPLPATERRGEVRGLLYEITRAEWEASAAP